jgi:hypothetical protein
VAYADVDESVATAVQVWPLVTDDDRPVMTAVED